VALESNVLDSCADSRAPTIVTKRTAHVKNIHKIFTYAHQQADFRGAYDHYVDK